VGGAQCVQSSKAKININLPTSEINRDGRKGKHVHTHAHPTRTCLPRWHVHGLYEQDRVAKRQHEVCAPPH
jgi:hypothetical protein